MAGILAAGMTLSWAAKAPMTPTKMEKEAVHVVTGKVLSVTPKVAISAIETAPGNLDKVFTIKVQVDVISKGAGIKGGNTMTVVASQPSPRRETT